MHLNKQTATEKIRLSEGLVLKFSALTLIMQIGSYFYQGRFYLAFFIGYALGIVGFFALSLTFSRIDSLPSWFRTIAILSSSFKILFLLAVCFLLKLAGFSITQVVAGLILSQLCIIASLVIIVYSTRKSVEVLGKKENTDACS